jgi:hypothetical protein
MLRELTAELRRLVESKGDLYMAGLATEFKGKGYDVTIAGGARAIAKDQVNRFIVRGVSHEDGKTGEFELLNWKGRQVVIHGGKPLPNGKLKMTFNIPAGDELNAKLLYTYVKSQLKPSFKLK